MRLIEVLGDCGHVDTVRGIAEQHEIMDCWVAKSDEEDRCSMRLLVRQEKQQAVIDAVQQALTAVQGWRIIIYPIEGALPRPEEIIDDKKYSGSRSREELYHEVEAGARLDSNFILLVIFSTIVAAIGLIEDNVAVVIGAMVIAPLLGPNIAFAFGAALGDKVLIYQSLKTNFTGILLTLVLSYAMGMIWADGITSQELLSRTDVTIPAMVLALVAGAAGVLSMTTGISSTLVGVMVAVALLPPATAVGLTLAHGNYKLALGAALLLAVNLVSVNLAAKLVLLFKGVKPRTWLDKQNARQSMVIYIIVWVISLAVLAGSMQVYHSYIQL
ncbi:Uncharacterized protein, MJ0678-like [hydrothermal vent metagenome]|uniref:Uncharacterized protein, MJ0678-like n=1 Tax=hydrothermal vent metagenome TaxID=652676 RepID=A0A3B0ZEC4_9ZZZZ